MKIRARPQKRKKKSKKKPSWGKIMMAVVFGLCIEIVLYAEAVMWVKSDISALYALIGVPAAMVGTFWAYASKSKAENTEGGITYDMAMRQYDQATPTTVQDAEDEVVEDDEVADDEVTDE